MYTARWSELHRGCLIIIIGLDTFVYTVLSFANGIWHYVISFTFSSFVVVVSALYTPVKELVCRIDFLLNKCGINRKHFDRHPWYGFDKVLSIKWAKNLVELASYNWFMEMKHSVKWWSESRMVDLTKSDLTKSDPTKSDLTKRDPTKSDPRPNQK